MKLYLEPSFKNPDSGEGGIRRVVDAQRRYLPEFGVEVVDDPRQAELAAGHGGACPLVPGKPFISMSHGLYWSDYRWEGGEEQANRRVIDALLCADAITVPSQWVCGAYVRGMLRSPMVVYHGIEPPEWQVAKEPGNYVLWNKPRHDAVSNVNDLMQLVRAMPDMPFVSTLGVQTSNLQLVGRMPYQQMKEVIQGAGVYLATARETFGIGTLEALACGVPVAGWNYGGQREIVVNGETGYLAEYGDYAALAECVRQCFAERARLSENARADALKRWQWPDKIEQYAALCRQVVAGTQAKPKVSILVTCHNLAKYLPQALDSVCRQTLADWECIVVDDASTDNTAAISAEIVERDPRVRYVRTPENLKLSGARNFGFAQAHGRYVLNLDADDALPPNALEVLVRALDTHPHLHIAYGALEVLAEDGQARHPNAFPGQFRYLEQMAHLNQVYYAALMRREVWEQVGGYRARMWRAEDAEFWCRATSFGFRAAKVTEATCLLWRYRTDGKSATERKQYPDIDGDWTADFPWASAHSMKEGIERKGQNQLGVRHWETLPFGAPVLEAPIWHRENPLISIIIPLGAGHESVIVDALDSCIAQTFGDWEAVVVNDTGKPIDRIPGAPYARLVSTAGHVGAGAARNVGLAHARAPLVLFLDADDYLRPDALALLLEAYRTAEASYIYSGWQVIRPDGTAIEFPAPAYDARGWLEHGQHLVTVLMATDDARRVGFDEQMPGYEDWEFFAHCAVLGVCGAPVHEQLVTYRHDRGKRSVTAKPKHTELVKTIRDRYKDYEKGAKEMASCCGGNQRALEAIQAARAAMQAHSGRPQVDGFAETDLQAPVPEGFTRVKFIGERRGPVTYYVQGRAYTGANSEDYRYVLAKSDDVQALENMGVWTRVKPQPQAQANSSSHAPSGPVQRVGVMDSPVTPVAAAPEQVIERAPRALPQVVPAAVPMPAPVPAAVIENPTASAPPTGASRPTGGTAPKQRKSRKDKNS